MSASPSKRASDVVAQQVEQIVSAAQQAADQIRQEAEGQVESIRADARRQAETDLNRARKDAILLSEDARRDAKLIVEDAQAQSDELRQKTQRAVQGRVAAAEVAAAEVLEEARALSAGLNQLARSLGEQAERILREVQTAHQRMQADLRIGPQEEAGARPSARVEPGSRATVRSSAGGDEAPVGADVPSRRRANPFEGLEIPSWERSDPG